MKKYATIALFVFWALVVAVLVAGLLSYEKGQRSGGAGQTPSAPVLTGVSPSVVSLKLSMAELAKHNSSQSCWLLISGKLYDVTSSINSHPGGADAILADCGTDATSAFDTKGGEGRPHSNRAQSELASLYIGDLNQTIELKKPSASQTAPSVQFNSASSSSKENIFRGGTEDDD